VDEVDLAIQETAQQLQAAKAQLAALEAAPASPAAQSLGISAAEEARLQEVYGGAGQATRQFGFDVGAGAARAGAGLLDVLGLAPTFVARQLGADPETTRYFPLTKELAPVSRDIAASLGVQPDTTTQEVVSFLAPSPLSKATALKQAGSGLAAYLGMKAGETAYPESPYAGLLGALAPGATTALATRGVTQLAPSMVERGKALQRAQFGAKSPDYTASKNTMLEVGENEFQTQIAKSADTLIQNKTLPRTSNPKKLYPAVNTAIEKVEDEIQTAVKNAEKRVGAIEPPPFERTLKYLEEGKVPADQIDDYLNEIAKYQGALIREGRGSIVYLNRQRKAISDTWSNKVNANAGFWRAFYRDIKNHIEKYVPEVEGLNKRKQDLVVIKPVVEKALKQKESVAERIKANSIFYTTGTAGLVGANVLFGPLGIPLALAATAAGTKPGRMTIGRALQSAGEAGIQPSQLDLARALQSGAVAAASGQETPMVAPEATLSEDDQLQQIAAMLEQAKREEALLDQATPEATATPTATQTPEATETPTPQPTIVANGQKYAIPTGEQYADPNLVKAIIQVESAGKPKAVSNKGATGLMQLMPATARDLGVNPKDPQQNIEGGSRYIKDELDTFIDPKLALAAYNWGRGNVRNALKQLRADDREETWENIVKYLSVPKETRDYVKRVLSIYNRLKGE
jgi:soluble lytic murein transglycosylase-like protein